MIYADEGFSQYGSGIYSGCPSFEESYGKLNHAVVIVGYDTNGNYIIKNSWGTLWGENGFGIVDKNNDCGLSGLVAQFSSSAPPRTGLVFTDQIKLTISKNWY